MLNSVKNVLYKGFGLNISSEIDLPELQQQTNFLNEKPDAFILQDELGMLWKERCCPPKDYVIANGFFMFEIPKVAIYLVQGGNRITVSPYAEKDRDLIRLYILGTCMGALLLQRRTLTLHGSTVSINGKAFAIVGDSGAGKSTLAASILNRGHRLLSDDLIAISLSTDNIPIVTPAFPQQKLWQESLTAFGKENSAYPSIFGRETKYMIPVPSQYCAEPLPLAGVFELVISENKNIEIRHMQGIERLRILFNHTYRNFLIPGLGLKEWHFRTTTRIAECIDIFQICRPNIGFTSHDLASLILNTRIG